MSEAHPDDPGLWCVWRLSMKWRAVVDRAVASLGLTHAQFVRHRLVVSGVWS
jgi:MarR family transcriptional regulator, organic hydroperoxide resistance regulator